MTGGLISAIRSLDLSYAAAQCLDGEINGLIPYEATILEPGGFTCRLAG